MRRKETLPNRIEAILNSNNEELREGLVGFLARRTKLESEGKSIKREIVINDRLRDVVRRMVIDDTDYLNISSTPYSLMMAGIGEHMTEWQLFMKSADDHYDNRTGSNIVAGYLLRKREVGLKNE
jgi:hypothetical protein